MILSSCPGWICQALSVWSVATGCQIKISQFSILSAAMRLFAALFHSPLASYCGSASAGAGRNLTDCMAEFIVMDEQTLQVYQMNTNTFFSWLHPPAWLMGSAPNKCVEWSDTQGWAENDSLVCYHCTMRAVEIIPTSLCLVSLFWIGDGE